MITVFNQDRCVSEGISTSAFNFKLFLIMLKNGKNYKELYRFYRTIPKGQKLFLGEKNDFW